MLLKCSTNSPVNTSIHLNSSSKWSDSFRSVNGNRNESSVHGLLGDEDAVEDDLELVNIEKLNSGGVDVAFTGEFLIIRRALSSSSSLQE